MCNCKIVRIEDVGYRSVGHAMKPFHKDCGDFLSESQAKAIEPLRVKAWGLEPTTG